MIVPEKKILSDIEIAQANSMDHIRDIARKLHIAEDDLEMYGKYKAKLPIKLIDEAKVAKSNLILVTALTPTPAGEGKTTVSIGLTEGLNKIGKKAIVVLREPSLGPVFGIKGGAAGGGYSQVVPMEDINLHFTGDFSAIEKANNLLSALLDNNIQSRTRSLGIDPRTIAWKRVMDMNDRALRDITIGLGGTANGIPRQDGFNITPASEVMAILCKAKDFSDLKDRLGNDVDSDGVASFGWTFGDGNSSSSQSTTNTYASTGAKVVTASATMNAGAIPADSWVHDMSIGGGRILGEACHFIDLCSHLAESKVISVCMNAMGVNPKENTDNASIMLKYKNGSTAVINYFANGSKAYSKERIEVYSQERTLVMDNWRELRAYGFKGFSKTSSKQDKGHYNQFINLIHQQKNGGDPIIPFDSIVNTTKASFAAIESIKNGTWIDV